MLIVWFLSIKSLLNLLFGVLCLPGDQSHPFAQPTINPLACCICWAGLLGRAVFPPWNEGPNSGSYIWGLVRDRESLGPNTNPSGRPICKPCSWCNKKSGNPYPPHTVQTTPFPGLIPSRMEIRYWYGDIRPGPLNPAGRDLTPSSWWRRLHWR